MGCCDSKCYACCKDTGLLIARLLLGLMFLAHGLMKFGFLGGNVAAAGSLMWWAGILEVIAGLLVTLGLFWYWSAGLAALHALAIFVVGHSPLFNTDNVWFPLANRGELALVYLAGFILLGFMGYGRYSIDVLWCKGCCKGKSECCTSDAPAMATSTAAPKRKTTRRKAAKRKSTKKRK